MRIPPRHNFLAGLAAALAVVAGSLGLPGTGPAGAADSSGVELTLVATPADGTAIAARPGSAIVYVAEQAGTVRALRKNKLAPDPVLDLTDSISDGGERGLLGLAFAPDGDRLYVDYTNNDGNTEVVEYEMRGNAVDPDSRRLLLTVVQPQSNHNGGQLVFGPDGMLYIGLGDGGAANDAGPGHKAGGNGQALDTPLGKILRIDPSPPTGRASGQGEDLQYTVPPDNPFVGRAGVAPEIWSYGLRNPWRFTFDSETGDLWIGDVGQNEWEEISFAAAVDGKDAGRGTNFGWNRFEATHSFMGANPPDDVLPVHEIPHSDGSCSVTGGYVYRGRAIPELQGTYLFIDYCRGRLTGLTPAGDGEFDAVDLGTEVGGVSTFGQRNNGELYLLSQRDGLYRIGAGKR